MALSYYFARKRPESEIRAFYETDKWKPPFVIIPQGHLPSRTAVPEHARVGDIVTLYPFRSPPVTGAVPSSPWKLAFAENTGLIRNWESERTLHFQVSQKQTRNGFLMIDLR
jgi:hypothetical protein